MIQYVHSKFKIIIQIKNILIKLYIKTFMAKNINTSIYIFFE